MWIAGVCMLNAGAHVDIWGGHAASLWIKLGESSRPDHHASLQAQRARSDDPRFEGKSAIAEGR